MLGPGQLGISINTEKLGALLEYGLEDIPQDQLSITAPFQLRKRGVETKLVFADTPRDRDDTLIQNIAKAHDWYQQVKAGKTLSDVARANNTSSRRIQQMIELAFLAPDITNMILQGNQPLGLTSEWCKQHPLPGDWQEQRALIATL